MNDFLKDLIKSVKELGKDSGFEVLIIVDDTERKYNEHIINNELEDNRLLIKDLLAATEELKALKEKYRTIKKLEWYKHDDSNTLISDNTLLHCAIKDNLRSGNAWLETDLRGSTSASLYSSVAECKKIAQELVNKLANDFLNN